MTVAVAAGCDQPQQAPVIEARPLSCASTEAEWRQALNTARTADREGELEAQADSFADSCPSSWPPHWIQGECRLKRGDRRGAVASFQEGLIRARREADETGVAVLANEVGRRLFVDAKQFAEAEALLRESIATAGKLRRKETEAAAANHLAGVLFQTGRLAEAARTQQGVVDSLTALQDPRLATARFNHAMLIQLLGDRSTARRVYEDLRASAPDANTRAKSAARLAVLETFENRWVQARLLFEEARAMDPETRLRVDLHQGLAALESGFVAEAHALLTRAATSKDALDVLTARMHLGNAELLLGNVAAAEALLRDVVRRSDEMFVGDPRWRSRHLLGRVLAVRGDLPGAIGALRESVQLIEQQGNALQPADLGLRYLVRRSDPYAELAAALTDQSGASALPEILQLLNGSHARALQEGLRTEERRLEWLDLQRLQQALPPGRLLIGFLLGSERGVAVAIDHEGTAVCVVQGLKTIGESIRRYRATLQRPLRRSEARLRPLSDFARGRSAGEELYRTLLAPFESRLARATRVDFVLDRELALVPPASLPIPASSALHARGSFIADLVQTALIPLLASPDAPAPRGRRVLLAGDPEPDPAGEFPRLPQAAIELEAIRAAWKSNDVENLEGPRLHRAALEAVDLSRFGLVHLATHAVASSRDPARCAVILSGGERLALDDVLELRLDQALVVLSACRTGEGELVPGEGVVGLAWAFLRAGAKGVVVSLWSVDDTFASRLMAAFHRRLSAGDDAVVALAGARREVAAMAPHPAYWAPFELMLHP